MFKVPPIAGTGLFDFFTDVDRKIVEEGPFELRILESKKTIKETLPDEIVFQIEKINKEKEAKKKKGFFGF